MENTSSAHTHLHGAQEREVFNVVASLSGLLLQHGFLLTSKKGINSSEFLELHTTKLQSMMHWVGSTDLDVLSKDHEVAERSCRQMCEAGVACKRFASEDEGVAAVCASVPEEYLSFFAKKPSLLPLAELASVLLLRCLHDSQTLVIALVYLARLVLHSNIPFTVRSAHRMLLGCCVVATKYLSDTNAFRMHHFAAAGRVSLDHLVHLEHATLAALNYKLFVDPLDFHLMMFSLRSCHLQVESALPTSYASWKHVISQFSLPKVASFELASAPDPNVSGSLISLERESIVNHCRRRRGQARSRSTEKSWDRSVSHQSSIGGLSTQYQDWSDDDQVQND